MSDLDRARVDEAIGRRGSTLGRPVEIAETTESTNDDAKAGARAGAPHGKVWLAETQTRGRGRLGRAWLSPPGENLMFSVLVRLSCAPARVPPVALACGLAVRDAVARLVPSERVLVKWPNDVVVRDREGVGFRKLAGVLVESAVIGSKVDYVVVGIGVNVHTRSFPPELAAAATSVTLESASPPDRAELLADILEGLSRDVEHVAHRGLGLIHARLAAHDVLRGREVRVEDARGIARGIDVDGRLLVEQADGVVARVVSGEATMTQRVT